VTWRKRKPIENKSQDNLLSPFVFQEAADFIFFHFVVGGKPLLKGKGEEPDGD